MTYALDTNIITYIIRCEMQVHKRFEQEVVIGGNSFVIPPITVYEIERWLTDKPTWEKRYHAQKFHDLYHGVREYAAMAPDAWEKAVEIYVQLKQNGALIEEADIFIAAYCIVNDYVLVTNNLRHFSRIKDLNCVNWVAMPEI